MDTVKKNKFFRPSAVTLAAWNKTSKADADERRVVLEQLEIALDKYSDDQIIDWFAHEVELQDGSSLFQIYNPGMLMLNKLEELGAVFGALIREDARDHDGLLRVTADGKMEVYVGKRGWVDLVAAGHFEFTEEVRSEIKLISDVARAAGGYIWTDLAITLDQWFEFHEIDVPKNKAQVSNLIALFKFDPQVDEPADYWEHFQTEGQTLVTLSDEQFSAIRRAKAKVMTKSKLLTAFYNVTGRAKVSHENAAQRIVEYVSYPVSQIAARKYLQELGWVGENEQLPVSDAVLRQFLTTAILLDLDPSIGHSHQRRNIGGFVLYSPDDMDRHPSVIRELLADFLSAKGWVDRQVAPLAAHLLLARTAPEFLVSDTPSSVTLGSIAWLNLSRAVALVEAVKTGASRVLSYSQIMAYADLEPVSAAQKHLRDLAVIDPIVDWALLNQVVTGTELEQAEEATTRRAIDAFEQYSEQLAQIARAFSTPLPSRAAIARAALKVAAPGCDTLDENALSELGGQQVMSMVDLHQSGDLVTGKWDRRTVRLVTNGIPKPAINYNPSGISLYTRYPQLLKLTSCDEEMDRQLAVYRTELNSAMLSTVKLALAQMPEPDLNVFMNAQINFLTVRGSAIYTVKRRGPGPLEIEQDRETQQTRDAATGRFGLVMFASHDNAFICYELFTSRGEFRKNDALGNWIIRERKLEQRSRMSWPADLTTQVTLTDPQELPLNLKCYTHAAAPDPATTTSQAILDNFGKLPKPHTSANPRQGLYQRFNDPNVARIARFIVDHRPFLHAHELRELVRIPTPLELSRQEGERLLTYFIDLVVPFKKCIEDIASGEHDKVVDGIYGCLMDGIGLVGTVAGAASKVVSISAKAISNTSKAARFTRLAFTSAISLFNPFDGVPSGLQSGGKLVHKGLLRFNKNTHEIITRANRQLHTISGRRHSFDLIESAGTQVGVGSWRPCGVASDSVSVLAARRDGKWYALNRRGDLWGKPLDGFSYRAPVQLPYSPKTLPESYTRKFVEQSLPRARAKIDNAINVIQQHDFKKDCSLVMKTLFGDTSAVATERLVNYLRLIRFDFAGFSMSNIVLDGFKEDATLAALDVDNYKRWKSSGSSSGSNIAFVEIHTKNLNSHFTGLGFNHDVVADDLIHELFHASAQTDDVGYVTDAEFESNEGQRLDITPLLNIAMGCLPVSEEGTECHPPSKAFANADSLAVATSLLSQVCTNKITFDDNMAIIGGAVDTSGGKPIVEPVIITLNKPV
ncbi:MULTISPECIES: hypothetical protein [Pseudomonas]|uniref:hypothetical protein n=1 Tax=Pseudomonas TaxID=286 RepID=UPI000691C6F5|nr:MULTISPECIES: hypothetical protein [Pseudomonas]POA40721.1 hypothetical protein C1891_00125 [Pseudomonas sp. GW456-12-1-14-TSB6]QIA03729.1 hypothetical protein GZH78_16800 [Pseudomonas fluorescens]TFA86541.1 hypothetical protein F638_0741 [Pseudomonas sp. LAIL14HWK12:I2]